MPPLDVLLHMADIHMRPCDLHALCALSPPSSLQESIMFENVHNTFQRLMRTLANMQNVLKVCLDQGRFGFHGRG